MELSADDVIVAIKNQRNSIGASAMDENAMLYAQLQAANREIAKLKEKYENHADSTVPPAG